MGKRKLKILHVSGAKSWRGGEQQIVHLMNYLDKKDHVQHLIAPKQAPIHDRISGNNIHSIKIIKLFPYNPLIALKINQICKNEQIDIVHIHDAHAHNWVNMAAMMKVDFPKTVVHRRVLFPIKNSKKYLKKHISFIIAISEKVKDCLPKEIKEEKHISIIPSGILLPKKQEVKQFSVQKNIISVGALTAEKNHFEFIELAKKLSSDKSYLFSIYGEGILYEELIEIIEKDNLKNIELKGFSKNLNEVYKNATILVSLSTSEGLGTAQLEAMSFGVPVIAYNAGGNDFVKNGGKLVAQDLNELVEALIEINDENYQDFSLKAIETSQEFSIDKMGEKTEELYLFSASQSSSW